MSSVDGLDDPSRLRGWLSQVAVFTARGIIRRRRRRRWLRFYAPEDVPEESASATQPVHDALRRARAILDRMDVDDRIAFALRFIDGMELTEVADACQVSLATIKRRLAAARARFEDAARHDPVLGEMLRERAAGERA
jgi:RNA polymerase sigma-70 factor (ECF subfamily)